MLKTSTSVLKVSQVFMLQVISTPRIQQKQDEEVFELPEFYIRKISTLSIKDEDPVVAFEVS